MSLPSYLANDTEEDDEGPKQVILWLLYRNDHSQHLLFHQCTQPKAKDTHRSLSPGKMHVFSRKSIQTVMGGSEEPLVRII
ncbi:Speedy Protein E4 [Manis pentadactyla]|nr:Speedy Protein E4 [Manis pentadactyla]